MSADDGERLVRTRQRLRIAAGTAQGETQLSQRPGLAGVIFRLPPGPDRRAVGGRRVLLVTPGIEELGQDMRQHSRMPPPALPGRIPHDAEEVGSFFIDGFSRVVRGIQRRQARRRVSKLGVHPAAEGVDGAVCPVGQAEVIVQYPVHGTLPVGVGVVKQRKMVGVLADQVMEGETPGTTFLQQVMIKQGFERVFGYGERYIARRRRGICGISPADAAEYTENSVPGCSASWRKSRFCPFVK